MKYEPKPKRCTTHHEACQCREYRFQQMEQALRAIRQLANRENPELEDKIWALSDIDIKAAEGLGE